MVKSGMGNPSCLAGQPEPFTQTSVNESNRFVGRQGLGAEPRTRWGGMVFAKEVSASSLVNQKFVFSNITYSQKKTLQKARESVDKTYT